MDAGGTCCVFSVYGAYDIFHFFWRCLRKKKWILARVVQEFSKSDSLSLINSKLKEEREEIKKLRNYVTSTKYLNNPDKAGTRHRFNVCFKNVLATLKKLLKDVMNLLVMNVYSLSWLQKRNWIKISNLLPTTSVRGKNWENSKK